MNSLQVIHTCHNRRNKTFKDTKAIKRRKKGLNKQINEEEGIDHVINEDDDRNLHNIDNIIIIIHHHHHHQYHHHDHTPSSSSSYS
jgi:hypothetical protein